MTGLIARFLAAQRQPMRPSMAFFGAGGLLVIWAIVLFLVAVFGFRSYSAVLDLQQINYHESGYRHLPIRLSQVGFEGFRWALWAFWTLASLGLILVWRRKQALYREMLHLGGELRDGWRELGQSFTQLPRSYQLTALFLLALLTAVRAYFFFSFPQEGDEVLTYMCFGSEGIVAATSFYPFPNNHILYSVISTLFHQLNPNFYWATRLPTFLISLGGTVLLFAAVQRFTNFMVALLTVGLFCFSPYGIYYSFVGRGYFLQAICSGLALLAVMGLCFRPTRDRLYWLVLLVTSILGFYTIPTYAYAFLPLMTVLGIRSIRRPGQVALRAVLATGILTGVACALLYSPVMLVSGHQMIFGNQYLKPLPFSTFTTGFASYFGVVLEYLIGQERIGTATVILIHAALLVGMVIAKPGSWLRQYGGALLLMLLLPYGIMAWQVVFPPVRTMMYLVFYLFLGVGILYLQLGHRLKISDRFLFVMALVFTLSYAGYESYQTQRTANRQNRRQAQVESAYAWLAERHPQQVYVENAHYQFFFQYYTRQNQGIPHLASTYEFGADYSYLVLDKQQPTMCPSRSWVPVREDEYVRIYAPAASGAVSALVPARQ
ncbi:hypothetical protein [Hymenobacter sp. DG25A]|uniref:hypothetical protein n=1 Tax=Hymenobacter sp. DG25A TaxID=1385663 RepID=UPI0006BE0AA6|nr:hypothetical protein [Hymenobacter sp. DG25A]ALD20880.1 hypothetical protein AM218_06130 [Hymenobacter sp. DG25A]